MVWVYYICLIAFAILAYLLMARYISKMEFARGIEQARKDTEPFTQIHDLASLLRIIDRTEAWSDYERGYRFYIQKVIEAEQARDEYFRAK